MDSCRIVNNLTSENLSPKLYDPLNSIDKSGKNRSIHRRSKSSIAKYSTPAFRTPLRNFIDAETSEETPITVKLIKKSNVVENGRVVYETPKLNQPLMSKDDKVKYKTPFNKGIVIILIIINITVVFLLLLDKS